MMGSAHTLDSAVSGSANVAPRHGIRLSAAGRAAFGVQPLVAGHALHGSGLFSDAALIELLDRCPRQQIQAFTMGSDITRPEQNRLALHDGVSGVELLRAVRNGRLWSKPLRASGLAGVQAVANTGAL